jgi:hypothetical protein
MGLPGLQQLAQDGYKIRSRYNDTGLEGLTDRSRRPYRYT